MPYPALNGQANIVDRAKLEGTILSRNTLVEERGQLKDCELAPGVATQPDGMLYSYWLLVFVLPLMSLLILVVSLKGERLSLWQSY
jgi:hypothetical protein